MGRMLVWNFLVLSSFVVASPSSVGMCVGVGTVSMYFLMVQIVLSSAFSTNSLHVRSFATLMLFSYSFCFFLHLRLSQVLPVFRYLLRRRFAAFRSSVKLSFHHLLLKGHIIFRGVVSCIARVIASVISFAYWSRSLGAMFVSLASIRCGRYSMIFSRSAFQSVFA